MLAFAFVLLGLILPVIVDDLFQTRHAILRDFPILGHFRYVLEMVGPELRQYIVTSTDTDFRARRCWGESGGWTRRTRPRGWPTT